VSTTTSILKTYIKDFNRDYGPHEQWLLLCAYTVGTSATDPIKSLEIGSWTSEEQDTIGHLVQELSVYQFRVNYFLQNELDASREVALACDDAVMAMFTAMMNYYDDLYKKLEQYVSHGFFEKFPNLQDACEEFADLVFDSKAPKTVDFVYDLVVDFYTKNNIVPLNIGGEIPSRETAKTHVIDDLLNYFYRSEQAIWPSHTDNPTNLGKVCSHKVMHMIGKEWVCNDCNEVVIDTSWDDDEYWPNMFSI
jgi:hypothetical protein